MIEIEKKAELLPNKRKLLEILPFASSYLRKNKFSITKLDIPSTSKTLISNVIVQAEAYPQYFSLSTMCLYGKYYEEYGRYFLGIVPTTIANNTNILPFSKDSGYCYGVVWSGNGELDLHLVYMKEEKIIGANEDITKEDIKAFAAFVGIVTE